MARAPRVVAHLGRPETPEETRERKAENSKNYRQSKTFTNLVFALVLTLGIVGVVYLIVPRGGIDSAREPDVAQIAHEVSTQYERDVIVPDAPDSWAKNLAQVEPGAPSVWTVNFNGIPDSGHAFLRFAQAFDADDAWASQTLRGAAPTGSVTIDGITWDEYEIGSPDQAGNVSYALGVQAGTDHVLLYGSSDAGTASDLAERLTDSIRELRQKGDAS